MYSVAGGIQVYSVAGGIQVYSVAGGIQVYSVAGSIQVYSVTNLAPAASCYTCNHWRKVWGGEGTPAPQLFEKILCILLQFCYLFCYLFCRLQ